MSDTNQNDSSGSIEKRNDKKAPDEIDLTTSKEQSKRTRNKTQRYGVQENEINDDQYFENLLNNIINNSNCGEEEATDSDLSYSVDVDAEEITLDSDGENQSSSEKQLSKRKRLNEASSSNGLQTQTLAVVHTQVQLCETDVNNNSSIEITSNDESGAIELSERSKQCDKEKSVKESENQLNDSQYALLSPGERVIFKMIKNVVLEMKILQRAVTALKVKSMPSNDTSEIHEIGNVDGAVMQQLGLPLQNEAAIVKFEDNLKRTDFHQNAV